MREVCVLTDYGRLLLVSFMAHVSKNHSKGVSYHGDLTIDDILISNSSKSSDKITIVLKNPVKAQDIDQATVKDLHKSADIIMALYKTKESPDKYVVPFYIDQFSVDLKAATKQLVSEKWFIKRYLCRHVAIVPASSRISFEILLFSTRERCKVANGMFIDMVKKMFNGWTVVGNRKNHISNKEHTYINGTRERRNYLVHGGANEDELELHAANIHGGFIFLPELVKTMLQQGIMEQ
jgi:hypothetical protein